MNREAIIRLARTMARERDIDESLLLALIEQESGFDQWAIRYEPAFYDRYVSPLVANGNLSKTEARLRAFSFGLLQVMGQTVRETGYAAPLPQLFDPATNLEVGMTVLKHKLAIANGDVKLALLRWNGGGRPAYAQEVLEKMARYA